MDCAGQYNESEAKQNNTKKLLPLQEDEGRHLRRLGLFCPSFFQTGVRCRYPKQQKRKNKINELSRFYICVAKMRMMKEMDEDNNTK